MTWKRLPWLCALAILMAPPVARAQDAIRLDSRMFVERITTDINGRARRILVDTDRAGSGDQVIFVIHWRNQGRRAVRDFAVTRPVPRNTRLALADPDMQVSVDGGARWGRLDQLWLPTPLGGVRRATPGDITHIRWPFVAAVSPGESGRISYRAILR